MQADEVIIRKYSSVRTLFTLPDIPPEKWCNIRADYESGMTLKAIADKYFCDPRTVRSCIINNKASTELGKQSAPTKLSPFIQLVNQLFLEYTQKGSMYHSAANSFCAISREITLVIQKQGYTGSERTVRNYLRNKYQFTNYQSKEKSDNDTN